MFFLFHVVATHDRSDRLGNPRVYWCFADETSNAEIAQIAKNCHKVTFYDRIFDRLDMLELTVDDLISLSSDHAEIR